MKSVFLGSCVIGSLLALTAESMAADLSAHPPEALTGANKAICAPEFQTSPGRFSAGTAFLARPSNDQHPTVLVTAHHLFGPSGGLPEQIGWHALPGFVQTVTCRPFVAGRDAIVAGSALGLPGARTFDEDGPAHDVAAFPVSGREAGALEFSAEALQVGQPVWLVAKLRGGSATHLFHRAELVSIGEGNITFRYDDQDIKLGATSGAPIVDASGKIVGINTGVATRGNEWFGFALGAPTAVRSIDEALDGLSALPTAGVGQVDR